MYYTIKLTSLTATENLAKLIAQVIVPKFVIALNGDLATGKTTLTRLILRQLGITGQVKSPTFTLVEPYQINDMTIYHFDLYRFNDPEEWYELGFDEYFDEQSLIFIEWATKAGGVIPYFDWQCELKIINNQRQLTIYPLTDIGRACLSNLINHAEA